ncbi:MAG: hypothetical protein LBF71_04750 [Campylobacteraceae bacterium]|nr:hypothetical protein [Campylobacteraceae bacterium]
MKFFNIINFESRKSENSEKYFMSAHLKSGESVQALQVEIKKTTHKTSHVNAEYANIHTHQGVVEGGDIKIKYLKGGRVHADTVSVDFAENGIIEANHIYIKKLGSRNKLTAADIIEIDKAEGAKNTITVKPIFDEERYAAVSTLYEKIMFYKKELEKTQKMAHMKRLEVENSLLDVQNCRAKIKLSRAEGKLPDSELLVKVREFDILSKSYRQLTNMIESLQTHIDIAAAEFKTCMEEGGFSYQQKVICNSFWKSGNKITFVLPKYDLSYYPLNNEYAAEIYLWYNCELLLDAKGEFEIKINKKE